MEIIVSKSIGFCFGVRRAIELAENTDKKEGHVYTLGPIIHNPQMIEKLEKQNVKSINDLSEVEDDSIIIIRAHGVEPRTIEEIKNRNLKIVDGTCPYVKRVQLLAQKLKNEGYNVVIIGKKDHPEVIGINGYTNNKAIIVKDKTEVGKIPLDSKVGVVIQTTQNIEEVKEILSLIFKKTSEIRVFNTICSVVRDRQQDVKKIAKNVDLMLVIGGKNSANTRKLEEISSKIIKTHHIETANEINKNWFFGVKRVGVTSGTSTPDFIIKEILTKLTKFANFHL